MLSFWVGCKVEKVDGLSKKIKVFDGKVALANNLSIEFHLWLVVFINIIKWIGLIFISFQISKIKKYIFEVFPNIYFI